MVDADCVVPATRLRDKSRGIENLVDVVVTAVVASGDTVAKPNIKTGGGRQGRSQVEGRTVAVGGVNEANKGLGMGGSYREIERKGKSRIELDGTVVGDNDF